MTTENTIQHGHAGFKTASMVCAPDKDLLKICRKSNSAINQMLGCCDELKAKYDLCLDVEFTKVRKQNLVNGRERTRKWEEARRSLGLE